MQASALAALVHSLSGPRRHLTFWPLDSAERWGRTLPHRWLAGKPLAEPGVPRWPNWPPGPLGWSGLASVSSLMNELNSSHSREAFTQQFSTYNYPLLLSATKQLSLLLCIILWNWEVATSHLWGHWSPPVWGQIFLISCLCTSRHGKPPRVEWKLGEWVFPAEWCEVCLSLCDLTDYTPMESSRPEY